MFLSLNVWHISLKVKYRNVAHNEFTPVTKSWPRGAEVDWKETPTAAYTRSVYLHPTHTIKGPQVWEPCSTFGSLKNVTTLERLASRHLAAQMVAQIASNLDAPLAANLETLIGLH